MTAEDFRAKRRQKFLTESYFKRNLTALDFLSKASVLSIQKDNDDHSQESWREGSIFKDRLNLLKLNYTAGCRIEQLSTSYAEVVRSLIDWHVAEHRYSKWLAADSGKDLRLDMTPVHFEDLFHFQLAIDVVSLGVLLGEGESLRQVAQWMSSARGTDLLFEYLIARAVPDPRENTEYFHTQPYDSLIDAFYTAETPADSAACVKRYLEGWYKSFEGVPWHNGHLKANEDYMPYYGYWSFEAAAVCVLHGIDDSSFRDHLVYPKDLADWARANHSVTRLASGSGHWFDTLTPRMRCEAGQPCPHDGWWFTPAHPDSRRRFIAGDLMPELGSSYGATIWQWDESQTG